MKKSFPIVLLVVIVLTSCSTTYNPQSMEYADYRVKQQTVTDSSILRLLSPYSKSLSAVMNEVIANVAMPLAKKQPEGTLGNVMADAILQQARSKFGQPVDIGFINYGGIRLSEVPAGPLTRGKVFELSPFDNTIVLITIKGDVLKKFLDLVASRGGWPVSGMRMQIADKKATQVTIDGRPLDANANYVIALPDYVANGGDDASMLKGLPRQDKGIVYRDELLAYFTRIQKEGKTISSSIEGRITNN
jgi:2',3'-cyclic-nucleotide 2'-phosphodiesterase (5'-nucleotidase family)